MRTLSPPRPLRSDESWKQECKCPFCEAVLEVERADLKVRREWDMCGNRDLVFAVCPHCGGGLTVSDPYEPKEWGQQPLPKHEGLPPRSNRDNDRDGRR